MRWTAAILLGFMALASAAPAAAARPAWQRVATVPGIFDIGGPRRDGWLVVAGAGKLYLVDPAGVIRHVSFGEGGYGTAEELIRQSGATIYEPLLTQERARLSMLVG